MIRTIFSIGKLNIIKKFRFIYSLTSFVEPALNSRKAQLTKKSLIIYKKIFIQLFIVFV